MASSSIESVWGVIVGGDEVETPSCLFADRELAAVWAAKVNAAVAWDGTGCPFARLEPFDYIPRGGHLTAEEERELLDAAAQEVR